MICIDGNMFDFNGPLGSDGAELTRVAEAHYHVRLGVSPSADRPRWVNRLQFELTRADPQRPLRLDVSRPSEPAYWFNEYALSMSSDRESWSLLRYQSGDRDTTQDTILIPPTLEARVVIGNQVPVSAERVEAEAASLAQSEFVTVREIGRSLGGRSILRVTVQDPAPRDRPRWSHYAVNHHPGEGNAIWRIIGLLRWAVSPDAQRFRENCVLHAIMMASPDSPSKGWSRCNAQGHDMNRAYLPGGADAARQAHESYVCQRDFESLMASDHPVTACWFMHTWGGQMEPFVLPGPEFRDLGGIAALARALRDHDPHGYSLPLAEYGENKARAHAAHWNNGPWCDYGVTSLLVEGSGALVHQHQNLACGQLIGRAMQQFYGGLDPRKNARATSSAAYKSITDRGDR